MLQDILAALTIPGLPDWIGLVLLLLLLLVGLAYLLMPFSVFGLKGRLDAIEAQLDEIQTELRGLALRLPDPGRPASRRAGASPRRASHPAARHLAGTRRRPGRGQIARTPARTWHRPWG